MKVPMAEESKDCSKKLINLLNQSLKKISKISLNFVIQICIVCESDPRNVAIQTSSLPNDTDFKLLTDAVAMATVAPALEQSQHLTSLSL